MGDKRGEAQTLLAAAGVSANRRDVARAIADYSTALQIATEAGYKREIGMALVGRGTARRLQGDVDAALADARQARDILRESGERREEGRALAEIGATLLQAGRVADASASRSMGSAEPGFGLKATTSSPENCAYVWHTER